MGNKVGCSYSEAEAGNSQHLQRPKLPCADNVEPPALELHRTSTVTVTLRETSCFRWVKRESQNVHPHEHRTLRLLLPYVIILLVGLTPATYTSHIYWFSSNHVIYSHIVQK